MHRSRRTNAVVVSVVLAFALTSCGADTMPACPQGQLECGTTCVDVDNDPTNCGACGIQCGSGKICSLGQCTVTCAAGMSQCAGACRDLLVDPANCGDCGVVCRTGEVCSAGQCQVTCGSEQTQCGNMCTNTSHDPLNCGACGMACPSLTNASPACAAGTCGFVCQAGFADCDDDPTNGCEVSLTTDVAHCGACNAACEIPANGTNTCAGGNCAIETCEGGFGDCDLEIANGCETEVTTDSSHCSTCGNSCADGEVCASGTCVERPTSLVPGNTTVIVTRDNVEATCTEWNGLICTQPKLRPVTLSCSSYAYASEWHAIHFDGNFFCFYATGDRTVITTGTSTWAGPPTVHGHWSTNTCAATETTLPHGYPSGALSMGTSLAWDWGRGAIGSIAVQCNW